METSENEEFQPTQELSQNDRDSETVASTPTGVWGVLVFSDDPNRRINLLAPKAVLGRSQQNAVVGNVQYVKLDGPKTS